MGNHINEYWLAYLTHTIVMKCLQISKERCPACKDNMASPLLHFHIQMSLLDKVKCYFEEIRGPMIKDIEGCFNKFSAQISITDDGANYHFVGQTFLMMATAESLYYGRYLDESNDAVLFPRHEPDAIRIFNGSLKRPSAPSPKPVVETKKRKVLKKPESIYEFDNVY